jgi:hypothetical protein
MTDYDYLDSQLFTDRPNNALTLQQITDRPNNHSRSLWILELII